MPGRTLQHCVLGRQHASVAYQRAVLRVQMAADLAHSDAGCSAKLVDTSSLCQGCGAHVEAGTLHCLQTMVF